MFDVRFRVVVWSWGWIGFAAMLVALPSERWVDCVVARVADLAMGATELVAAQFRAA